MGTLMVLFNSQYRDHDYTTYQQDNRSHYKDISEKQPENRGFKGAGVIMLGPIPIVFGNDRSMIKTSIILVLILMITWFLLFR